jgi:hypothetical protein
MSRTKLIVAIVLVAVVGGGVAVWLWKPWAGAPNARDAQITFNKPESAKLCTVVCVNKTDKSIDSLGLKYSGQVTLTDSGGQLLMMVSAGNSDYGLPVGLQPGERRSCFRLFGGGQLDSVTAIVGKASTPHVLNEELAGEAR